MVGGSAQVAPRSSAAPQAVAVGPQGAAGDSTVGNTLPRDGAGAGGGTLLLDAGSEDAYPDAAGDGTEGAGAGGGVVRDGGVTTDGAASDAGSGAMAAWSCDGDYAFGAPLTASFFVDPTPPALASALTATLGTAHPISLVLHLKDGALIGALSATISAGVGKEVFLPDEVPLLAPVVLAFGSPPGVTSVDPQPRAMLGFQDEEGSVDVELEHVVWRATQGSTCADMSVSFQAVLPPSQFSVVVHLAAGDRTIGELISASGSDSNPRVTPIGRPTPTPIPVEIAAVFQGTPLDFDFDTL